MAGPFVVDVITGISILKTVFSNKQENDQDLIENKPTVEKEFNDRLPSIF